MIKCDFCNREFKTSQSRCNHMKKFHSINDFNHNISSIIPPKMEV